MPGVAVEARDERDLIGDLASTWTVEYRLPVGFFAFHPASFLQGAAFGQVETVKGLARTVESSNKVVREALGPALAVHRVVPPQVMIAVPELEDMVIALTASSTCSRFDARESTAA